MSTDDTITAWGNHVDGAVALTKLRGMDQFNDPISHAMFRAVRTMMVMMTMPQTASRKLMKIRSQAAFNARSLSTRSLAREAGLVKATYQRKMLPTA